MVKLGSIGITSILLEGGAKTFSRFLEEKLVDEALIFLSPKVFGEGIQTFDKDLNFTDSIRSVEKVGTDVLMRFVLNEY
jgi:riboflavin biosynthesis pyrimidine reductase